MANRDYLEPASECLQMAQQAKNSFERTILLDITGKWLLLAGDTTKTRSVKDLMEVIRRSPYVRNDVSDIAERALCAAPCRQPT